MPIINFGEIFYNYVDNGVIDDASIFALNSFSKSDLEGGGFDLVGNPSEFHLYEKEYLLSYCRRVVYINFKHYFVSEQRIGNGFDIARGRSGIRLITLLRHYIRHKNLRRVSDASIEFYFSGDRKYGAAIINGVLVVQFEQKSERSGYVLLTLESDVDRSGKFSQLSTGSIRSMMNRCELNVGSQNFRKKYKTGAFGRLMKFCLH